MVTRGLVVRPPYPFADVVKDEMFLRFDSHGHRNKAALFCGYPYFFRMVCWIFRYAVLCSTIVSTAEQLATV